MPLLGEWWIDDAGQVLFADGDVGDMNHETYVLDGLARAILDHLHMRYDEEFAGTIDNYDEALRVVLRVGTEGDLRGALERAVQDLWPDERQRAAALDAAYDITDPREYAIQYNGWKRLKGTNVETWTLTRDDLAVIVRGIEEAAEDDEITDGTKFFIEVRASGKCFSGVPWEVLQEAQPTKLRTYQMF